MKGVNIWPKAGGIKVTNPIKRQNKKKPNKKEVVGDSNQGNTDGKKHFNGFCR
jgi:hypothetical protein